MSSSPLLQGSEEIDKNSTGLQNRTVQFVKLDNPIFLDITELNTKELGLQALIDISSPLSLSTKNVGEVFERPHSSSSSSSSLSSTFCGFVGGGESKGGG
jgi:hypothetical protein